MNGITGALRVLLVVSATACGAQVFAAGFGPHAVRYLMGTWCDLVLGPGESDGPAAEAAFQEIARLERILSNWDETSEISALNGKAGHGPQTVSVDLARVLYQAQELCRVTAGAFDPSVGSLVHAWGFDTESPSHPAAERAHEAARRIGCDRTTVQLDPPSVTLSPDTRLDVGGIGKGYAVDRAMGVLRAHGVQRARMDFGSSSLGFLGEVDDGWLVVIPDPRHRDRPLLSFRVEHGAVSSSGQQERSFTSKGRRYGHIFNPRTGAPVDSSLLLVTVIAPNATVADALSTALFVLGFEDGSRVVSRQPHVAAIFIEQRTGGDVAVKTVGAINQLTRLSR